MSTRVRLLSSLVLGVLALGLVGTSLAWACSFDGVLDDLDPSFGPPGTAVDVSGGGFLGKVEIHWGSADGQLLGTAESNRVGDGRGTRFDTRVSIPDDALEGSTTPVVVTGKVFGFDGNAVKDEEESVPFTAESEGRSDGGGGSSNDGRSSDGGAASDPASADQAPGPAPASGPALGRPGLVGTPSLDSSGPGGRPRGRVGDGRISAVTTSDRPGSAPSGATRATNDSGQTVFGGSVAAPRGQTVPSDRAASPDGADDRGAGRLRAGAGPSERSATGDLWSGFGSSESPSLSSPAPVGAVGPGSQLWVGASLLGLGLVALLGGFGVADVRRRRELARTTPGGR